MGCAGHGPLYDGPPEIGPVAQTPPGAAHVLSSGLRVVPAATPSSAHVAAALLFRGGPANDPPDLPGLTEWLVRMAPLGASRSDGDADGPHERALALGSVLVPIANGRVFGWAVAGPAEAVDTLLTLLADVTLRPTFPASRLDLEATFEAERIAAEGHPEVDHALAVAAGAALGLPRPVQLGPGVDMLERVNREDVRRHWQRTVLPDRGVLVLAGMDATSETVASAFGTWHGDATTPPETKACTPQGRTVHFLPDPGMSKKGFALLAARMPGPGHPARRAVESLLDALSVEPGGPIERHLGREQARRARPEIVDLGARKGRGLSVFLAGTMGKPKETLQDLGKLLTLLEQAGSIETEDVAGSWRTILSREARREAQPFVRLTHTAERALYGLAGTEAPGPDERRVLAEAWLASWRIAVVGVGGTQMREALSRFGPVTVWSGDLGSRKGPEPPRCLP